MSKKNLYLGGVLIILIALAYLYQGPLKDWRGNLGKPKNFLAQIDADQITKIEVIKDGQTTTLEKQGDKWKINGTKDFFVSASLSQSLVEDLKKAATAEIELASSNKGKKSEFQTDDSGTRVKLYYSGQGGDEAVADFIIGKRGADFASAYVAEPASDSTYSLKANIYSLFYREDWYDKAILALDKEKINKIRFQYPNQEFTVEKKAGESGEENWEGTIPYKFSVSKEKMDKILDALSNLSAVKIPEQEFAGTGLEKHSMIVQATGEGIDSTVMIGDAAKSGGEELFYAKKGDSDNIYLISKEQKNELNKKIEDLK